MTDHFDEMSVAPDPARAEALRRRLHERMASGGRDAGDGTSQLDNGTTRFTLDARPTAMKEFTVSDNPTTNNHRDGRRLAMAAAAVVAVIAVTAIAFAINDTNDDDQAPSPAATIAPTTLAPVTTAAPTTTQATATAQADVTGHGALEGRWTTDAIPIEQIRTTMLQRGFSAAEVDQWVTDVGSPTDFTFSLEFNDGDFSHFATTPQQSRQVDDTGTFAYDPDTSGSDPISGMLTLRVAAQGNTYVLESVMTCCDDLKLHFVDPTGDSADPSDAEFARAVALYTSASFHRRP